MKDEDSDTKDKRRMRTHDCYEFQPMRPRQLDKRPFPNGGGNLLGTMQIVISKTADGVSMALLSAGLRRGASGFTRTDGFASYGVLEMERKDEHRD